MLQNEHICIREYKAEDVDSMYDCIYSSIPEMKQFLPWVSDDYSHFDAEEWVYYSMHNWRRGLQYDFVIEDRKTGQFLGGVGILSVIFFLKNAKLGYWIRTDAAGRGVATQASELALQFAREYLKLETILIECDLRNKGSIRVAQKLGARQLCQEFYEDHNGCREERYIYQLEL